MRTIILTDSNYSTMLNALEYAYECLYNDMGMQGEDDLAGLAELRQLIDGIIAENGEK